MQLIAAHFGDGLRTGVGRRRPVLAFLAPLTAAASYLLISPPAALDDNPAFYAASTHTRTPRHNMIPREI